MTQPILRVDNDDRLILEAPRVGPVVLTLVLLAMTAGAVRLFPDFRIAQGLFAAMALWAFTGTLKLCQLRLELAERQWTFRDGWIFQPPKRQGSFDDIAGVFVDRNEFSGGARLRSRLVTLEFRDWPDGDGSFPLGFPMGPRAAEEKATEYAGRLGVEWSDRSEAEGADEADQAPRGMMADNAREGDS